MLAKIMESNSRNNLLLIAMLVVTMVVFSSGISLARETEAITDDLGNEVELEEDPARIVSLAPSITEMLYELGLGDRVVGVTSFCDYPSQMLEEVEAGEVETIGSIVDPNIEKIVEVDPDLVVAANINPREDVERLQELGLKVAGFAPIDLDSTFSVMERTGKLTGFQQEANEVIDSMQSRLEQIEALVAEQEERPAVFYEIWNDPLQTAGSGTFIDDIIRTAGGHNLGAEAGEGWPQFSLETLIMEDPEVYVSTPHSAEADVSVESIKERDHFDALTAVQEGRVHLVDQDKLSRPGPRVIDGLIEITEAIYPQLADELSDI